MVTAFGLANAIGSVLIWSDLTLAGFAVGIIWAIFGWKGLPIVPCGPESSDPGSIAQSLGVLRRRRALAIVVPVLWLPIMAFGIVPIFGPRMVEWLFGPSAVLLAIPVGLQAFSECPRCRQHFFLGKGGGRWRAKCVHCGLPLRGQRHEP